MPHFTIAGQEFELDRGAVERTMRELLPDPVNEHYVVVSGRRFPPKQVIASATGLDRADFTTHQARRVLKRLGFTAARKPQHSENGEAEGSQCAGKQADALAPYVGKWIALDSPTEVLVAADTPQEILAWLARHEQRAGYGMFRVPATPGEAEGSGPT